MLLSDFLNHSGKPYGKNRGQDQYIQADLGTIWLFYEATLRVNNWLQLCTNDASLFSFNTLSTHVFLCGVYAIANKFIITFSPPRSVDKIFNFNLYFSFVPPGRSHEVMLKEDKIINFNQLIPIDSQFPTASHRWAW